jgi:hypothetical protein
MSNATPTCSVEGGEDGDPAYPENQGLPRTTQVRVSICGLSLFSEDFDKIDRIVAPAQTANAAPDNIPVLGQVAE